MPLRETGLKYFRFVMILKFLVDFIFQPRCLSCAANVAGRDGLCSDCFCRANFITEPSCRLCGHPFEFVLGEFGGKAKPSELVCRKCARDKPAFTAHRAVMLYDEVARSVILPLKHADDTKMARFMAKMMGARAASFISKIDVVAAVPIHFSRLLRRK